VARATGQTFCDGSSYADAEEAMDDWLDAVEDSDAKANWRDAAERELDFLKSLREPEETAVSQSDSDAGQAQ
jgi:hypothetical protein